VDAKAETSAATMQISTAASIGVPMVSA